MNVDSGTNIYSRNGCTVSSHVWWIKYGALVQSLSARRLFSVNLLKKIIHYGLRRPSPRNRGAPMDLFSTRVTLVLADEKQV